MNQLKLFTILMMLFLFLLACDGSHSTSKKHLSVQYTEEAMLAKLAIIRSYHRRAIIDLKLGKRKQALKQLNEIIKIKFPLHFRAGQEAIIDAWSRKTMLLLKWKRYKEALNTINEAISSIQLKVPSFYVANLYHVKGRVLEGLKQPRQALRSYQHSIELNKKVIQYARKRMKGL